MSAHVHIINAPTTSGHTFYSVSLFISIHEGAILLYNTIYKHLDILYRYLCIMKYYACYNTLYKCRYNIRSHLHA